MGHCRASLTWVAIAVLCGCGSSPPAPGVGAAKTSGPVSRAERPPEVEADRARRTELGEAAATEATTRIEAVEGDASVLFVATFGDAPVTWAVRREESGRLGPVLTLRDAFVARAIAWGDGSWSLVTAERDDLCISTYEATSTTPATRRCHREDPDGLAKLGDRIALLYVRPPPDDDPKPGEPAPKKKPKPKKKPPKKGKAKTDDLVELAVRFAGKDGSLEPPPPEEDPLRSTDLTFYPAMLGMDLIDARGRGDGIDLLFYEDVPDKEILPASARAKKPPKGVIGRARIASARLDAEGKLIEDSKTEVVQGDLEHGLIPVHQQPRLATGPEGSAYIGLQGERGPCVGRGALPRLGPTGGDVALCAVDPRRFASGGPLGADERAAIDAIFALKPRRAFGQPGFDPEQIVWGGERGFFLREGRAWSATRAGVAAPLDPAPLLARRGRVAWGTFTPSGEGIAFANGELFTVDATGAAQAITKPNLSPGAIEPSATDDRRFVARIGDRWWLARGKLTPLDGDGDGAARDVDLHPDADRLIGGARTGLLLTVGGGTLAVSIISPNGALRAKTPASAPVRFGYDAVERSAGGALVAGYDAHHPARIVTLVVDAEGTVGAVRPTTLTATPGGWGVRLTPLPGGGALLTDRARTEVVWLDADGAERDRRPWPRDESPLGCLEGTPQRELFPAPTPGRFVSLAKIAAGSCVVGDPTWGADGSLRWVGTRYRGADTVAEAVLLPFGEATPAAPSATSLSPPSAEPSPVLSSIVGPPRCPPEMVDVAGRFCIDRFEASIVDAASSRPLSTDYPTTPNLAAISLERWARHGALVGDVRARAFPVPFLPEWQRGQKLDLKATSRGGVRPNGYVTGLVADGACRLAGKRLCKPHEFVQACRGEDNTLYPYGSTFDPAKCNVHRSLHPAAALHKNASIGHLDPRLNRVREGDRPLLLPTGSIEACRSRWGDDAVYDMVGNLDEWVDDKGGAFAGGFFARSTRAGCEALIEGHPRPYLDYSTGVRCCQDATPSPQVKDP